MASGTQAARRAALHRWLKPYETRLVEECRLKVFYIRVASEVLVMCKAESPSPIRISPCELGCRWPDFSTKRVFGPNQV